MEHNTISGYTKLYSKQKDVQKTLNKKEKFLAKNIVFSFFFKSSFLFLIPLILFLGLNYFEFGNTQIIHNLFTFDSILEQHLSRFDHNYQFLYGEDFDHFSFITTIFFTGLFVVVGAYGSKIETKYHKKQIKLDFDQHFYIILFCSIIVLAILSFFNSVSNGEVSSFFLYGLIGCNVILICQSYSLINKTEYRQFKKEKNTLFEDFEKMNKELNLIIEKKSEVEKEILDSSKIMSLVLDNFKEDKYDSNEDKLAQERLIEVFEDRNKEKEERLKKFNNLKDIYNQNYNEVLEENNIAISNE